MKLIREIYDYREMILRMVQRELRGRYKGSILGYLWTLINPLLQLLIYTIVFSIIMRADYQRYYLFLFVALVPWLFFSSSILGGTTLLISQKELVNKIYFPREVLPIAHVLSQLVNMCLSMIIIFVALIVLHEWIGMGPLIVLPVIVALEFIMALGFTFLVSSITVYFRDFQFILSVIIMGWQFLSPVMYGIDLIPSAYTKIYFINPMTWILLSYRDVLYYKQVPSLIQLSGAAIYSIVIFMIGFLTFEKLKIRFSEEL